MKFLGKVSNGPMNKRLNFGGFGEGMHCPVLLVNFLLWICTCPFQLFFLVY